MPAPPLPRVATLAQPGADSGRVYLAAAVFAVAAHAAVIFGVQPSATKLEQVEFGVEVADASVEVTLIAALPAEEPVAEVPPEPEPEPEPIEPPPPEPIPEPPPPPIAAEPPEMTLPEPAPIPAPRPVTPPRPKPERAQPKPQARRPVGDGSSTMPGNDATTARASTGGASAKPGYLRNPHPQYPEAARLAKQEGVVVLRVSVDAGGSPASVQLTRSSGFPLLDERARSTVAGSWKFKPATAAGVAVPSSVTIPIRFTLTR